MYTPENLKARKALRNSDLVQTGIATILLNFQLDAAGMCSKKEYFRVFREVGYILRGPDIDPDKLEEMLEDDFEEDM